MSYLIAGPEDMKNHRFDSPHMYDGLEDEEEDEEEDDEEIDDKVSLD